MLVAMVCRDGANRAPSRVAWLDRRVTKRRQPAINKEDINPNNPLSTLDRSSSPSPTYKVHVGQQQQQNLSKIMSGYKHHDLQSRTPAPPKLPPKTVGPCRLHSTNCKTYYTLGQLSALRSFGHVLALW